MVFSLDDKCDRCQFIRSRPDNLSLICDEFLVIQFLIDMMIYEEFKFANVILAFVQSMLREGTCCRDCD